MFKAHFHKVLSKRVMEKIVEKKAERIKLHSFCMTLPILFDSRKILKFIFFFSKIKLLFLFFLLAKDLFFSKYFPYTIRVMNIIQNIHSILYEFIQSVKFVNIQPSDLLVIKEFLGNQAVCNQSV